ncbi:MAG: YolD-like family protein [Clostridiales bacterium]|nr:YolD-like family protein [Clostridiales bacterium]
MPNRTIEDYQDIINLPHFVSKNRTHLSMIERAAQFSPFAALTGYESAVQETARLTGQRLELAEDEKEIIARRLTLLHSRLAETPVVDVTFFIPDEIKDGGEYRTVSGVVKKLDEFQRLLCMMDGTKIPVDDITSVEGAIFHTVTENTDIV